MESFYYRKLISEMIFIKKMDLTVILRDCQTYSCPFLWSASSSLINSTHHFLTYYIIFYKSSLHCHIDYTYLFAVTYRIAVLLEILICDILRFIYLCFWRYIYFWELRDFMWYGMIYPLVFLCSQVLLENNFFSFFLII